MSIYIVSFLFIFPFQSPFHCHYGYDVIDYTMSHVAKQHPEAAENVGGRLVPHVSSILKRA